MFGYEENTQRGKKRLETARLFGADQVYDTDEMNWQDKVEIDFPDGF